MNDGSSWPLAYFITFACYGTRLHGDPRGSVDRHHNQYGEPQLGLASLRLGFETSLLKGSPVVLTEKQRQICDQALREVCDFKGWDLHALNVRTNHVHIVVTVPEAPEPAMNTFKSWATRRMREAAVIDPQLRPWGRHGSTRYLWDEEAVAAAIHYVLDRQTVDDEKQHEPTRDR
jgi:REP element-mobilizing transposase RayT